MPTPEPRVRMLRRMAWACAALVLAVTSLSAFIRLSRAGLGCEPWPQCYAQRAVQGERGAAPAEEALPTALARLAHRVAAMVTLIVILLMAMTTLTTRPAMWREGRQSLALLGLALFLAVLGRWTADARLPAVALGNLLAGFVMLALAARLAWSLTGTPAGAASTALRTGARVAAALLLLQVALGGMVSVGHAGLSCPELPGCDVSRGSWQALDPWRVPALDAAEPSHPAGALLHAAHRVVALVVGVVLLALGAAAWRAGRRAGAVLVAVVVLQVAVGAALVKTGLPLMLALVHNVVAALLLALTLTLAGTQRTRAEDAAR